MTTFYKANGNTYNAKSLLKDAGFSWNAIDRCWVGTIEAVKEFERTTDNRFSRGNAKAAAGITFEEIVIA